MSNFIEFFSQKKSWSKYKDLILSYYLSPYLAKVSKIADPRTRKQRPIAVIDCFAGPGKFDDGEPGSPLIIAEHLELVHSRGVSVQGLFIEKDPTLFSKLQDNLGDCPFPAYPLAGDFRKHIDRISELACSHTVFIYLDPIQPGQLLFNDLQAVYSQIDMDHSVETLVNFLSTGFMRRAKGLLERATRDGELQLDHHEVTECDAIAGGDYWQSTILDPALAARDQVDKIAGRFSHRLRRWFDWTLLYPLREKYSDDLPKYHLVFGSRHPDAVDLMNRAMVKARREFVQEEFVAGMLFANEPELEVPDEQKLFKAVLEEAQLRGRTEWKLLRAHVTIACPCQYTDSEINKAIKRAIREKKLCSTCDASKIANHAEVWLA